MVTRKCVKCGVEFERKTPKVFGGVNWYHAGCYRAMMLVEGSDFE